MTIKWMISVIFKTIKFPTIFHHKKIFFLNMKMEINQNQTLISIPVSGSWKVDWIFVWVLWIFIIYIVGASVRFAIFLLTGGRVSML